MSNLTTTKTFKRVSLVMATLGATSLWASTALAAWTSNPGSAVLEVRVNDSGSLYIELDGEVCGNGDRLMGVSNSHPSKELIHKTALAALLSGKLVRANVDHKGNSSRCIIDEMLIYK